MNLSAATIGRNAIDNIESVSYIWAPMKHQHIL